MNKPTLTKEQAEALPTCTLELIRHYSEMADEREIARMELKKRVKEGVS